MTEKRIEIANTGMSGINDGIDNSWTVGTSGGIVTVAELVSALLQFSQNREIRWQSEKNAGEILGVSESSDDDYTYLNIV
jgi:hypothetical protein